MGDCHRGQDVELRLRHSLRQVVVSDGFDDGVGEAAAVPYYGEIQRMVCELAADFAEAGSDLYDIGCSTATTLLGLDAKVDPAVRFVGIDNAPDTIEKAKEKMSAADLKRAEALAQGFKAVSERPEADFVPKLVPLGTPQRQ